MNASCWRVEVVNGADGFFFVSFFSMDDVTHSLLSRSLAIFSASFLFLIANLSSASPSFFIRKASNSGFRSLASSWRLSFFKKAPIVPSRPRVRGTIFSRETEKVYTRQAYLKCAEPAGHQQASGRYHGGFSEPRLSRFLLFHEKLSFQLSNFLRIKLP